MSRLSKIRGKNTILKTLGLLGLFLMGLMAFYSFKLNYYYEPEKAAQYATENANKKSVSLCASYVRQSLEAGGCPTFFYPKAACDYKDFLLCLDFKEVPTNQKREIGDIVVFEAIKNHPYGHIAIWNGKQWISDFKQRNIIVAKEYNYSDATYFRQTKGKHRRKFFGSGSFRDLYGKMKRDFRLILSSSK